ncbi:hypothetical protein CHS0354_038019 [Potamilus streckersoni]|nr:hypothetical protein CHS0354_038019 [Potamilus streckersoni]
MQCDDVVHPMDCATVALCQPGEICYTESQKIHGENRYRLGCVKETSCQLPRAPETITTISPLLDSCGICCKRDMENCNLELCDYRGGSVPNEIVQMYLIEPPIDFNEVYCHDESETGCILAGTDKPEFCDNPNIKNHLCPKFCGTCGTNIVSSVSSKVIANLHHLFLP